MGATPEENRTGPSISRRTVIKGAVVAGGALWATPVIQSVNMAAARASTGSPLQTCYSVKVEASGMCDDARFSCLTPTGATGGCYQHLMVNTRGPDGTWILTLATNCHFVEGFSKCGRSGCNPGKRTGDQVIFSPCPKPGGGYRDISNIEFTFCCHPAREASPSPSAPATVNPPPTSPSLTSPSPSASPTASPSPSASPTP